MAVHHGIAVNAGVIHADYTGEIRIVLVNLFDKDHQIRAGDRIALLIPEKILQTTCKEVQSLEKTDRGNQGFGSTDRKRIGIEEISTQTHKRTQQKGDMTGLLWGRYVDGKLKIWATNISTELAIKSKKE